MIRVLKDKRIKVLFVMIFLLLMFVIFMKPCYAAGDVSGAIESAWGSAKGQIKVLSIMSYSQSSTLSWQYSFL